ncbi:MAG: type IV pilin [Sulfolobales archaeon]
MDVRFLQAMISIEVLNSLRRDRPGRSNNVNPVLAVVILVAISVIMSGVFASYIVGIFQDNVETRDIDIRIISVARLGGSSDGGGWNIYLDMRNRGGAPVTIKYIELYAGASEIYPSIASNPNVLSPIVIRPGESRLVSLLITNRSIAINRSSDMLIFTDESISEGMWITIRLVDGYGNKYYISLQLP